MASGVGVNGGPGRCYSFWVEFTKCLETASVPIDCKDYREDYIECLHHRKEFARNARIAEQVEKNKELDSSSGNGGNKKSEKGDKS